MSIEIIFTSVLPQNYVVVGSQTGNWVTTNSSHNQEIKILKNIFIEHGPHPMKVKILDSQQPHVILHHHKHTTA